MMFDEVLLWVYRALAAVIAVMMARAIWQGASWRVQLFAALVFVPFALRAAGIK